MSRFIEVTPIEDDKNVRVLVNVNAVEAVVASKDHVLIKVAGKATPVKDTFDDIKAMLMDC